MKDEWPDPSKHRCGRKGCDRVATSAFDAEEEGEFLYSCAAHREEALAIVFAQALGFVDQWP